MGNYSSENMFYVLVAFFLLVVYLGDCLGVQQELYSYFFFFKWYGDIVILQKEEKKN